MGTETNISKPLIIANSDTWIEGNAVQQLETIANKLKFCHNIHYDLLNRLPPIGATEN